MIALLNPPACLVSPRATSRGWNKLAKARKTRKSPRTLGLRKFGPGKLRIKKVTGSARLYSVQQGYIGFSKVIFGSARLYSVQQGYMRILTVILSGVGSRDTCVSKNKSFGLEHALSNSQ